MAALPSQPCDVPEMREQWRQPWGPPEYDDAPRLDAWKQRAHNIAFPKSSGPRDWTPSYEFLGDNKLAKGCPGLGGWTFREQRILAKMFPRASSTTCRCSRARRRPDF
eukprot:3706606-Pyramimonas_sp.AAC.1